MEIPRNPIHVIGACTRTSLRNLGSYHVLVIGGVVRFGGITNCLKARKGGSLKKLIKKGDHQIFQLNLKLVFL